MDAMSFLCMDFSHEQTHPWAPALSIGEMRAEN